MAATLAFSGARAVFTLAIAGQRKQVAFASGVHGGEEISYEPVEILDHLAVREWVPTAYRTNLSANTFRTVETGNTGYGSPKKQGWFPKERDILISDEMTAFVADRITKQLISKVDGVKASSYSYQIGARGVVSMDVQFVCIRGTDESEIPAQP